MQAHWSREDLPHWDKIRDADDMAGNGLRSRVIDIALDAVVDHLNANYPKSDDVRRVAAQRDTQKTKARRARRARDEWQRKCEIADDNASMWFGEAVEQRERADRAESLAEAAKAAAHTHLETLVSTVAKRDAAVKRAEAAGRELAAANDELSRLRDSLGDWDGGAARQQMQAWDRLADHPFFADCYRRADGSLIDAMMERLDDAIKPLVSYYDICKALRGTMSGFVATLGESIIHDAADAVWVLLDPNAKPAPAAEPDPVEDKARELWEVGWMNEDDWQTLSDTVQGVYRRIARRVLGADDE